MSTGAVLGERSGGNGVAMRSRNYKLKLRDIFDSIFNSLDKDVFSANSLFLKITWNVRNRIQFSQIRADNLNILPGVNALVLTNVSLQHYI